MNPLIRNRNIWTLVLALFAGLLAFTQNGGPLPHWLFFVSLVGIVVSGYCVGFNVALISIAKQLAKDLKKQ